MLTLACIYFYSKNRERREGGGGISKKKEKKEKALIYDTTQVSCVSKFLMYYRARRVTRTFDVWRRLLLVLVSLKCQLILRCSV